MKRFTITLSILSLLLASLFPACDELEDHYSTNPTLRLSFSADTLSFDTIFSAVGSATRQFMIYNKNQEPLNIESIMLASGEATGFRMNVDGRKGSYFDNVGIQADDSMYVFVEVTVDPNGGNQPLLIQDSVLFTVNGTRQSVLLEAYGQDVHLCKGGVTLHGDTTLAADRPYLVYDSLVVAPDAQLRIEPGTTFYLHDKANLIVHGTMLAQGTLEQPITFRGDRLDYILNDILPYDRTPGQWGGICLKPESYGNVWSYVEMRNATTGLRCEASTPDHPKLTISDSRLTNSSGDLLLAINCDITASNSEFSNAGGSTLALIGGKYAFAHCTVANFMSLTQRVTADEETPLDSKSLYLLHNARFEEGGPYPITQARFDNCIIDGSYTASDLDEGGEIEISADRVIASKAGNLPDFDFRFNHCVLKAQATEDSRFTDNLFTRESPSYRMTGGKANKYTYDFRPDSATTLGVGKADPEVAKRYPTDRYGISRLGNESGPAIGAYEFTPEEEKETGE